ncbi:MAG: hypothetical protein QXD04_04400, partial [Candidatus Bathyarchaeia archaeon]
RVDWKVEARIDRDQVVEDIIQLVGVLRRQRPVTCIVSASDEDGAIAEAYKRFETHMKIPSKYIRELVPRRLR